EGPLQSDPSRRTQGGGLVGRDVELEDLLRALHAGGDRGAAGPHAGQLPPGGAADVDIGELLAPGPVAQVYGRVRHFEDVRGGVRDGTQQAVRADGDRGQRLRDLLQGNDCLVQAM